MSRILPIIMAALLVALVAAATVPSGTFTPNTAEGAVQAFFGAVKARNWDAAFNRVADQRNVDKGEFIRELNGRNGSLRTLSSLQQVQTQVLREGEGDAMVRANLQWSTAVGAMYETRDVRVVRRDGDWKLDWHVEAPQQAPPQVIPVNYLRWDIIYSGGGDQWGAQNVEAPRVRIISMNAVERDGSVIVMGEVVNEDTVPAFVSISATLQDKNGEPLAQESSFDKINHTLLPKEVSPFRVDFPNVTLKDVKNVRLDPTALLVPASADPVIGVFNQKIEKDSSGKTVLRGELVNQSGQTVEIPHVLATYYDNAGRVIWVADGYLDKALLPQTPVPFAVDLRSDLAANVQSYRVTVNHYSRDQRQ